MNPLLKTSPLVDTAADILQLRQQLARRDQALYAAEAIIQELREALRLERIKRFGKQSETLSDLQLELLVGDARLLLGALAQTLYRCPQDTNQRPCRGQQRGTRRRAHGRVVRH